MMTLEEYASDVGKTVDEIIALCDNLGIKYEDEETILNDEDIIVLDNNRARSNESRFEHIAVSRHELLPSDIKQIPKRIETSILKKDKERTNTYNIYIARNGHVGEYIKISIEIDFKKSNIGFVKTIYITRNNK